MKFLGYLCGFKSLEKNDQMQPDATDINGNEVDAGSKLPLKRESNTSEEETARDAPPQVETGELNLSESLPIPKIQPSNLSSSDAQHLENENDQPLDDSMTRPLALDDVPNIDDSAKATPRSYDDIPVGTVFAFQKEKTTESPSANHTNSEVSAATTRRGSRGSAKSSGSSSESSNRVISNEMKNDSSEKREKGEKNATHEKADELLQELNSTISQILAAATEVEAFLTTEPSEIPLDIKDEITAVVGGCRLLCQDKLGKQFRNLCLKAKGELPLKKDEVAPPTEEDLVGFWELVNIQVDQMKEKCQNIKKLKENSWQVEKKEAPKKVVKKKAGKTPAKKSPAQIEAQKKRDEERKARLAALRAKKIEMNSNQKNDLDGGD
ncbi:Oidioi.mRNA.OKI2018_I69.XSR.g13740.t1.cds [Oikopleura dioica]|uniref:Oidioi.mRNA.OKI2018_I69.XSR.g13740.t1.cds n=1 Tax=Oikopleura dioica TaxID=34765 RepID=A0ABN7S7R9_OIKDI|nr:Oidioi.mRNA.OKI2018_I69.XSR.g13740.t1.cds [Oikopleura dioica]